MISLLAGSATDVGLVRQNNEDSVLVANSVFAVADGMGGYAGGALASAIAVTHLRALSEKGAPTSDDVYEALNAANNEIVERGRNDVGTLGMGTTVAGLALVQNSGSDYWLVFNVGDSRVYRFAADRLEQVSVDHSYTQELVEEGRITPEEALTHPERNVVTRALGSEPDVAPDLWLMAPERGETFLLCSDGLTRELTVLRMEEVLRATSDPQSACDQLVAAALEAGGKDNVSVVVVRVDSAPLIDESTTPPGALRSASMETGWPGGSGFGADKNEPSGGEWSDVECSSEPDEDVSQDDEARDSVPPPNAIISDVPMGPLADEPPSPRDSLDLIDEVPGV